MTRHDMVTPATTATPLAVRMRPAVMQVVLNLHPGGAEQLVVDLATRVTPYFRSLVCCLEHAGPLELPLARHGIPVFTLNRQPGFHPSLGQQIAALTRRYDVGVLHCHHYSPFVYGRIAALLRPGLRVVFTDHGRCAGDKPSLKRRVVNPALGRLPGRVFAVSGALRKDMVAEGFPAGRVNVIHNGIDPGAPPTPAERRLARVWLGLAEDTFVIGTAARLDPVKDFGTLIDAVAIVRQRIPAATLVILGDGPERARLEEHAHRAGVRDAVFFVGYRADARSLFPAFDLYVNSSIYEGVSLTLLEAMAACLPIVATDVGGTPEVLVDGETGVLVSPRAAQRLAYAIVAVSESGGRRVSMGAAGRARLERLFTTDRMVAEYLAAYERRSSGTTSLPRG